MGESLVEAPKVENKMGESVPCLQESVSFGRFEHDSLSWERWSTFPTNKYLEEVENCSTPGSVAQKKAYFEAHYKKIAARKAELMDQEKNREFDSMNSEDQSQNSAAENGLEIEVAEFTGEINDAHLDVPSHGAQIHAEESEVPNVTGEMGEHVDEANDVAPIIYENEASEEFSNEIEKHEEQAFVEVEVASTLNLRDFEGSSKDNVEEGAVVDKEAEDLEKLDTFKELEVELAVDKSEEGVILKGEIEDVEKFNSSCKTQKELPQDKVEENEFASKDNEDVVKSELLSNMQKEFPQDKFEKIVVGEKETKDPVKLENRKKMQKEMPTKKAHSTENVKKKPASPIPRKSSSMPKSPMMYTPKSSKPALSKTAMSTTRPSLKKENGYTPLTSRKATKPEGKKVLPTSLHMSLSLSPANSDPAMLTTTRKSLIMEKMGDKDIVKRAFKAFQNFSHLSPSSLTKTPATNQFVNKKAEKASALGSSRKKLEGITRVVKPSNPVSSQQGTRKTAVSPGVRKTVAGDQKNGKSLPASSGMRSQNQGHKQKELEKPTPFKTPSQDMNSKVKLSSTYNKGHVSSKELRKDGVKIHGSS